MKKSTLLLSLLLPCAAVRADVSYTQVTSSPFGAMMGGAGGMVTKVYAKGDSSRTESQVFGNRTITITQGAKKLIQIDPATKTYTVSNLGAGGVAKNFTAGKGKLPAVNMTVSTRKIGVENVRGTKAPHYLVTMAMKMQTPRGPQNMKMGMDIWSSNISLPTSAKTSKDAMDNMPVAFKSMLGPKSSVKGDLKGMSAAFKNVPLRMKISMNGQVMSTTETSNISAKPLSAALFTAPSGYRAVSNEKFAQTQQAAMRKMMSGMVKKMPQGAPSR